MLLSRTERKLRLHASHGGVGGGFEKIMGPWPRQRGLNVVNFMLKVAMKVFHRGSCRRVICPATPNQVL